MPDPTEAVNTYANSMRQGDAVVRFERVIVDTWLYGCDASTGYFAGVTDWLTGEYDVAGQLMEMEASPVISGSTPQRDTDWRAAETRWCSPMVRPGSAISRKSRPGGSDWFAYGFSGTVSIQHLPGLFILAEGAADVLGTHMALHELMLPDACNGGAQAIFPCATPMAGGTEFLEGHGVRAHHLRGHPNRRGMRRLWALLTRIELAMIVALCRLHLGGP